MSFMLTKSAKREAISAKLHRLYDRVAKEPVPDDMLKLLERLQ